MLHRKLVVEAMIINVLERIHTATLEQIGAAAGIDLERGVPCRRFLEPTRGCYSYPSRVRLRYVSCRTVQKDCLIHLTCCDVHS
jgi:hypothetical protein